MLSKIADDVTEEESLSIYNSFHEDWLLFVDEVLGITLDEEQREIVRSVQKNQYILRII